MVGRRQIPFGVGGISRFSASPRQLPLTISSCAQSHYISRLQSDTAWQKQQLIMFRRATHWNRQRRREIDKADDRLRQSATRAPEDGCDVIARWRRRSRVASFVADANFARRYGRLCKPIGGASMVLERGARISGEITD